MPSEYAAPLEQALRDALSNIRPPQMRDALLAAVMGQAARTRPLFCLTVARAAGNEPPPPLAWASAIAIELIHCASLTHDDLPCFDNADERRGEPTLHRRYDEPTALLAGDALIVAAFAHLARAGAPSSFIAELARATGAEGGLITGQAFELDGREVDIDAYHAAKTGSLFEAAARMAAASVGEDPAPYTNLGRRLGAFYQLADDVADAFGDAQKLGKPIGQDEALGRPNVVANTDRALAVGRLEAAERDVLDAVPKGDGAASLSAFLKRLFERLRARIVPA